MKKLCAGILSILLIFSLLPLAALGDETTTTTGSSSESSAPAADSKVTIVVSVLDKTAVVATVKDKDGKAPEGLSLKLTVDGVEKETKAVEKKTQVMFDYTVAVGDTEIVVSSDKQTVGDVTYAAARGSKTLEYTPEELLGFTFVEYERTFDGDTGRFYVRWNEEEAGSWTINRILVDGVGYRAESLGGNLTAALIDIPHGAHKLSYVFAAGDKIKVTGTSLGKGYQGVMRRWNFKGSKDTHGCEKVHRSGGSIGNNTFPGHVFKGRKMAGHWGAEQVTVQGLEIVDVRTEDNVILIRGSVPGPKNGLVLVRKQ